MTSMWNGSGEGVPQIHRHDERRYCPRGDMKNYPRWTCKYVDRRTTKDARHPCHCHLCVGPHATFLRPRARCNGGQGKPAKLGSLRKEVCEIGRQGDPNLCQSTSRCSGRLHSSGHPAHHRTARRASSIRSGSRLTTANGHLWSTAAAELAWSTANDINAAMRGT